MNKRRKLPAFTLMELIISLALSSLVVIFSLTVFLNIQEITKQSQQQSEFVNTGISEISLLRRDFENAKLIKGLDDEIHLIDPSFEIVYTIRDSIISRNYAGSVFSFRCRCKKIILLNDLEIQDLVKEISFDLLSHQNQFSFIIRKEYPPEIVINYKN